MYHKNKLVKETIIKTKNKKRNIVFTTALLLVSLIPVSLLFTSGFPVTDDGTWLIVRFSAFFETLRSGQLPVRFIYRLYDGMGYPVSNFLYPLYLYIATPIHILGFNFLNSIKILLIINVFLSSIFTFFWLNKKFSSLASFFGAIALIFSPYFLFDIYKRGSVGELLTFSIVPFILWQIERRSFIPVSIGLFLLILSHNSLAVLFLFLILFYVLINKNDFKLFLKSLVLGLGLSAFFWTPALWDLQYTVFFNTSVSSFYNYLLNVEDLNLIGLSSIIFLITSVFVALKIRKKTKDLFFLFSIILSIFIIFLQFPQSKIFWEIFPFRDFIQFPFRLLSILTILLAFQAAFTSDYIKKYKNIYIFAVFLILVLQTVLFMKNVTFQNYDDSFYSTNRSSTTVADEYLTKWFNKSGVSASENKVNILSGEGNVQEVIFSPHLTSFKIVSTTPVDVQVNILYFPGWELEANGDLIDIEYKENGLINFKLEKGESNIVVKFKETKVRKSANIVSLTALLILAVLYIKKSTKNKFNNFR